MPAKAGIHCRRSWTRQARVIMDSRLRGSDDSWCVCFLRVYASRIVDPVVLRAARSLWAWTVSDRG